MQASGSETEEDEDRNALFDYLLLVIAIVIVGILAACLYQRLLFYWTEGRFEEDEKHIAEQIDPEYQELRRQNYVWAKQLAAPVIDDEDHDRHMHAQDARHLQELDDIG